MKDFNAYPWEICWVGETIILHIHTCIQATVWLAHKVLFKLVQITDGRIVEALESYHKVTKEGVYIGCLSCASCASCASSVHVGCLSLLLLASDKVALLLQR